jgi:hypothetical protein
MPYKLTMIALFKLINFATVIGLVTFLYRKYGAALLASKMAEDEQLVLDLQNRLTELARQKSVLDDRAELKKQQAAVIEAKIDSWVVAQQHEREQQLYAAQVLRERMLAKQETQNRAIEQQWLAHKVVPVALKEVQEQLERDYAAPDMQERYTDALIQMMKKR